ncbi:hypothetical protein BASA81_004067 [Batrachochytrium salamandrivorans]|nr:hypothetical protein BASA81_004067 [Batrachochytrium salamandrivorans]
MFAVRRLVGTRRFTTAQQQPRLVYSGGFENVLTILKRVSWTVAFVVVVFAFGTTAALNVICKPYVVRMYLNGANELSVEL